MTDRELLELAAKAAGIEPDWSGAYFDRSGLAWNPLKDDGDALRLAVKLELDITPYPIYQQGKHSVVVKQRRPTDAMREANPTEVAELYEDDPYAATRRAIVRAAAEIGKGVIPFPSAEEIRYFVDPMYDGSGELK